MDSVGELSSPLKKMIAEPPHPQAQRIEKASSSKQKKSPAAASETRKQTPKEKRAATTATYLALRPSDVLLGRGKRASLWQGNLRYKRIIYSYLPEYEKATKNAEKTSITGEIVSIVKRSGGRFLKENSKSGELSEVSDLTARLKVGQAMRHRRRLREMGEEDSDDEYIRTVGPASVAEMRQWLATGDPNEPPMSLALLDAPRRAGFARQQGPATKGSGNLNVLIEALRQEEEGFGGKNAPQKNAPALAQGSRKAPPVASQQKRAYLAVPGQDQMGQWPDREEQKEAAKPFALPWQKKPANAVGCTTAVTMQSSSNMEIDSAANEQMGDPMSAQVLASGSMNCRQMGLFPPELKDARRARKNMRKLRRQQSKDKQPHQNGVLLGRGLAGVDQSAFKTDTLLGPQVLQSQPRVSGFGTALAPGSQSGTASCEQGATGDGSREGVNLNSGSALVENFDPVDILMMVESDSELYDQESSKRGSSVRSKRSVTSLDGFAGQPSREKAPRIVNVSDDRQNMELALLLKQGRGLIEMANQTVVGDLIQDNTSASAGLGVEVGGEEHHALSQFTRPITGIASLGGGEANRFQQVATTKDAFDPSMAALAFPVQSEKGLDDMESPANGASLGEGLQGSDQGPSRNLRVMEEARGLVMQVPLAACALPATKITDEFEAGPPEGCSSSTMLQNGEHRLGTMNVPTKPRQSSERQLTSALLGETHHEGSMVLLSRNGAALDVTDMVSERQDAAAQSFDEALQLGFEKSSKDTLQPTLMNGMGGSDGTMRPEFAVDQLTMADGSPEFISKEALAFSVTGQRRSGLARSNAVLMAERFGDNADQVPFSVLGTKGYSHSIASKCGKSETNATSRNSRSISLSMLGNYAPVPAANDDGEAGVSYLASTSNGAETPVSALGSGPEEGVQYGRTDGLAYGASKDTIDSADGSALLMAGLLPKEFKELGGQMGAPSLDRKESSSMSITGMNSSGVGQVESLRVCSAASSRSPYLMPGQVPVGHAAFQGSDANTELETEDPLNMDSAIDGSSSHPMMAGFGSATSSVPEKIRLREDIRGDSLAADILQQKASTAGRFGLSQGRLGEFGVEMGMMENRTDKKENVDTRVRTEDVEESEAALCMGEASAIGQQKPPVERFRHGSRDGNSAGLRSDACEDDTGVRMIKRHQQSCLFEPSASGANVGPATRVLEENQSKTSTTSPPKLLGSGYDSSSSTETETSL